MLQPSSQRLDPYAVAYAVTTLLNNLFGRAKEPLWQQAYTDLLKFVISLRRISEGMAMCTVFRVLTQAFAGEHHPHPVPDDHDRRERQEEAVPEAQG